MGLFGLNTEAICFGDPACIAKRDGDTNKTQAEANALNAIAAASGKKDYTTIIIVCILSFVAIAIVGSVIYLKTKKQI